MDYIFDLVDPGILTKYVRSLKFPQFALGQFLPSVFRESLDYRLAKSGRQRRQVAPFRAFDNPAAIGGRGKIKELRGSLPPISYKIPLTEHERLQLETLRREVDPRLVDELFDDAASTAMAVVGRIELARAEALTTGKVTINENGLVDFEIDYGLPVAHNVAAAIAWSNVATADPLEDLLAWKEIYVDTTGESPGTLLTSTKNRSYMLRNVKIREAFSSLVGSPSRVSSEQLNGLLEDHDLPKIVTYDEKVVDLDGNTVRILPEERLVFLPPAEIPVGETQWGVTAEALELAGEADVEFPQTPEGVPDLPGLVITVLKSKDPVTVWTKASGIGLPVIGDAELLLSADTGI